MAARDKGESYLNGRRGIVKEGVKVRGVPSGFGCDFDMQYAVVDCEAHENDPYRRILVKTNAPDKNQKSIPRKKPTVARIPAWRKPIVR